VLRFSVREAAAVITAGLLGPGSAAFAQPAFHVELGPVVRVDRVEVGSVGLTSTNREPNTSNSVKVVGILTSARIGRHFGVDAEFTEAWGRLEESWSDAYYDNHAHAI
jgi:hypothetical protein